MAAQRTRTAAVLALAAAAALILLPPPAALAAALLEAPPGAAVELADGPRSVAQLLSEHWAARDPPPGAGAGPGAWCCVPVWNGRSLSGEAWSAVVASDVELSTDPLCGAAPATRVCPGGRGFPLEAAAFVNLCPGSAGCGGGGAEPPLPGAANGTANGTRATAGDGLQAPQMSPPIVLGAQAEQPPPTAALNGAPPLKSDAPEPRPLAPAGASPQQPGNATGNATAPAARNASSSRPPARPAAALQETVTGAIDRVRERVRDAVQGLNKLDVVVLPGSGTSGARPRVRPHGCLGAAAAAAVAAARLALL
ncbi:hypothetical protein Rsub_01277 [Raphidocelis subcapitata]|uniref:Uncharacterized protein n=1 Tax=Raphidocelis subcapitata TaxID=307507 RepID=A0A2V0NPS3_9CHLO|nr:hypothetical protein Rsub_01277 [Raphidocelis subcapitata]|eukprot:GBF88562.1 hypothetical protein Rsub_01277 [Raphidocelis subcapitata]